MEHRFLNSEKILCFSNDYARFFCYESRQLQKRVKDWRLSFYYWFYVKYLRAGLYPNHINFYQISHTFMITAYFNQITPFLHQPPSTNASFWRIIIFKKHLDRFALKNNFCKAKTIELLETVHLSDVLAFFRSVLLKIKVNIIQKINILTKISKSNNIIHLFKFLWLSYEERGVKIWNMTLARPCFSNNKKPPKNKNIRASFSCSEHIFRDQLLLKNTKYIQYILVRAQKSAVVFSFIVDSNT